MVAWRYVETSNSFAVLTKGNRVEHSEIKFVSTRGRVISSIYKSIYTCNLKTAPHSIILKLDFGTPLLNKMPGHSSKTSAVVGSNERRLYCRLYHS